VANLLKLISARTPPLSLLFRTLVRVHVDEIGTRRLSTHKPRAHTRKRRVES